MIVAQFVIDLTLVEYPIIKYSVYFAHLFDTSTTTLPVLIKEVNSGSCLLFENTI